MDGTSVSHRFIPNCNDNRKSMISPTLLLIHKFSRHFLFSCSNFSVRFFFGWGWICFSLFFMLLFLDFFSSSFLFFWGGGFFHRSMFFLFFFFVAILHYILLSLVVPPFSLLFMMFTLLPFHLPYQLDGPRIQKILLICPPHELQSPTGA